MTISSLAMTAKKVIDAAWLNGDGYDLATEAAKALESAQLLQSPETAAEADRLRARVAELESGLPVMQKALFKALDRVTELESERHVTNEALSEAAEALRADRDRITEMAAETDGIVRRIAPVQAYRDEDPFGLHHTYRVPRDLPEMGGAR